MGKKESTGSRGFGRIIRIQLNGRVTGAEQPPVSICSAMLTLPGRCRKSQEEEEEEERRTVSLTGSGFERILSLSQLVPRRRSSCFLRFLCSTRGSRAVKRYARLTVCSRRLSRLHK